MPGPGGRPARPGCGLLALARLLLDPLGARCQPALLSPQQQQPFGPAAEGAVAEADTSKPCAANVPRPLHSGLALFAGPLMATLWGEQLLTC